MCVFISSDARVLRLYFFFLIYPLSIFFHTIVVDNTRVVSLIGHLF
jgi:hypothetical protein